MKFLSIAQKQTSGDTPPFKTGGTNWFGARDLNPKIYNTSDATPRGYYFPVGHTKTQHANFRRFTKKQPVPLGALCASVSRVRGVVTRHIKHY